MDDPEAYWQNTPTSETVPMEEAMTYLSNPRLEGQLDVMEVFGGQGGVPKVCIRRRLRTGDNFDLVSGMDLTKRSHIDDILQHVDAVKPLVGVGAVLIELRGLSRTQDQGLLV